MRSPIPITAPLPIALAAFAWGCGAPAPAEPEPGIDTFREQALSLETKRRPGPLTLSAIASPLFDAENGLGLGGREGGRGLDNRRSNGDETYLPQNEPAIGWSPARPDRLIVGANDYRAAPHEYPAGAYTSYDGGKTFQDGVLPGLTAPRPSELYEAAGDAAIACSADGDCYYATIAFDRTAPRSAIAVSRTRNGGRTFDPPTFPVRDSATTVFHDKEWIAVDNSTGPRRGTVYVSWTRFSWSDDGAYLGSPIYLSRSSDRGATWSTPVVVSPAGYRYSQGSRPVVDHEGRLFVVYESYSGGRDVHVIQRSDDGGITFQAPRRIAEVIETPFPLAPARYRGNSFPAIAADLKNGALHVVWNDNRYGSSDILLITSINGGFTWTAPIRVNSTPQGAPIQHLFPAVACGPQGRCGVSFYSTRDDPGRGALLDVYFAPIWFEEWPVVRARAGRNLRVSNFSSDPNVQFRGQFIGDYTDLVIDYTAAHPVWTDTREKRVNWRGVLLSQQDIFTATVPLPEEEYP